MVDQENNFYLISLSFLITYLLDNVRILYREVTKESFLGAKGFKPTTDRRTAKPVHSRIPFESQMEIAIDTLFLWCYSSLKILLFKVTFESTTFLWTKLIKWWSFLPILTRPCGKCCKFLWESSPLFQMQGLWTNSFLYFFFSISRCAPRCSGEARFITGSVSLQLGFRLLVSDWTHREDVWNTPGKSSEPAG